MADDRGLGRVGRKNGRGWVMKDKDPAARAGSSLPSFPWCKNPSEWKAQKGLGTEDNEGNEDDEGRGRVGWPFSSPSIPWCEHSWQPIRWETTNGHEFTRMKAGGIGTSMILVGTAFHRVPDLPKAHGIRKKIHFPHPRSLSQSVQGCAGHSGLGEGQRGGRPENEVWRQGASPGASFPWCKNPLGTPGTKGIGHRRKRNEGPGMAPCAMVAADVSPL
jgi:hypothetical protein